MPFFVACEKKYWTTDGWSVSCIFNHKPLLREKAVEELLTDDEDGEQPNQECIVWVC